MEIKWSLYEGDKFLEPIVFSNGKSQLDVVKEIIKAIKEGNKIIFIKGVCGTGKSAIALNVAKEIGRASVVVPVKPLQKQYEEDYTHNLYILKNNGEKLKISIIDGRNNHKCVFKGNCTAEDRKLPCTIEIKNENMNLIDDYLKKNPFVDAEDFKNIKDIRRKSIAPACPYWSPIICKEWFDNDYSIKDAEEMEYNGLKNKKFVYNKRKEGCGYYDQFISYVNSDVIIFNSKKYELENMMDRKPATEIEVIDECDEFLDSLSNERIINLNRLSRAFSNIKTNDLNLKGLLIDINEIIDGLLSDKGLLTEKEIFLLRNTKVLELLKCFMENPDLVDLGEDETSDYLFNVYQVVKSFEGVFDETYVTFHTNDYNDTVVSLITVNLERKLNELIGKNKVFIMMSGTIHSDMVLKKIFGVKEFKVIEAETSHIGNITKVRTNLEKVFDYRTLSKNGERENYLKALSKCVEIAEKPVLVHVNAFSDLPTGEECNKYGIVNLKTRRDLEEEQNQFRKGELVQNFKKGKIDIFYSTKCNRGVDFPGEVCNSIIYTKYPFSNVSSLFWRILKRSKPEYFNLFYLDKSRREYLQRMYRGLRSKNDHINLLSPDLRVLNGI